MDTLRFLIPFCRPYWRSYLFGIFMVPLSTAAMLAIPYLTGEAVGLLQRDSRSSEALWWVIVWILICTVVRGLTLLATRHYVIGASRRAEYDLRGTLFAHLQRLDQLFYTRSKTGDLMARMSSDVDRSRVIIGPVIMYSVNTLFLLGAALPLMIDLSWKLTLLVAVPLCFLTVVVRFIGPRVHTQMVKAQETLSDMSSHAQEDFAGTRVVKSFAIETAEEARFEKSALRYYEENLRAAKYAAWMHPVIGAVGDLGQIFILLAGGWLILAGQFDLPSLVKFTGYQLTLLWPMLSIGWVVNQFQRGSASAGRIRELLSEVPQVKSPVTPLPRASSDIQGAVAIRSLSFSYGRGDVLRDVSLEIAAGKTVAIVGRTGSGKSTLVSLIPRIYPAPPGTVLVDGQDVSHFELGTLRGAIGFVPQESFLFSRTIGDNIAFGANTASASESDIRTVAEATRLDKDVDQFPRGYEEIVGERGVTLSGGQRQRAALARALLRRPSILILDDALSAVDAETEEEIVENLKRFTRDMTTVIVSHRLSSVRHADQIVVLDEGRIIESGTHDELVRAGGAYAETHRLQLIAGELENL